MTLQRLLTGVAAAILAVCIADAQPFTYTLIDHEDAVGTSASGINARGDIVGSFTDLNGVQHGYLLRRATFTSIDYPGAVATQARGINSQGDIVGTHQGPKLRTPGFGGDIHGFLLRDGTFTPVDYPGHMNTVAQRITPSGDILGCYHDHDTMATMRGMVFRNSGFAALDGTQDGLEVFASMTNGSSPGGVVITGLYTDMMTNEGRAFVITRGEFSPLVYSGAIATSAWDMNAAGEIVGVYVDGNRKTHGFLWSGGQFYSIDYPQNEIRGTQAFGINPQGDIVGSYIDKAGVSHGFLATRPPNWRQ